MTTRQRQNGSELRDRAAVRLSLATSAMVGLLLTISAAAHAQTPASKAFTYQGRLVEDGLPVTGPMDLAFTLWSAPTGGSSFGSQAISGVPLTDGLFTVVLNGSDEFGGAAFDGDARWLEVRVNGIDLAPRQPLTAAPYAVHALNAPDGHSLDAADGSPVDAVSVDSSGRVGIGTTDPQRLLHLAGAPHPEVRIEDTSAGGKKYHIGINSTDDSLRIAETGVADRITIAANGNVGIGTTTPQTMLDVVGTTRTHVLTITGGSDLAEPFDIHSAGAGTCDSAVQPGMVVVIDPARIGELRIADRAYDPAVAGIVSGAGGVRTGLTLRQTGTIADGQFPVALTGRVWCLANAEAAPIAAGDLLTTSDTPGHAMKVLDRERANGAILGKAMSPLPHGRGLVLVLVGLQ